MKNWQDDSKVIAITGNIGSGKSTVASFIEEQGYLVLYSDRVAKDIIKHNTHVRRELINNFGESVYDADGIPDNNRLREIIFESNRSDENRKKMNSIIHPVVFKTNIAAIEAYYEDPSISHKDMVFIESALAFESGMAEGCDYVIQVSSGEDIATGRVIESRGIETKAIEAIRASQLAQQEKERLADFTIHNDKDLETLKSSTNFILNLLTAMPPRFGRETVEEEE